MMVIILDTNPQKILHIALFFMVGKVPTNCLKQFESATAIRGKNRHLANTDMVCICSLLLDPSTIQQ